MKHKESEDLYELHADFCKVIANSTRLKIFSALSDGEQSVGSLAKATGSSLANVSQHLRILRDHNILRTRKEGRTVYYRLRDPRLVEACKLTRTILMGGIQERGALARRSAAERGAVRVSVEMATGAPLPRLRTSPRAPAARNHRRLEPRKEKRS
jgi:DNA-binding transcriptional ArsR family regulator